MTSRTQHVGQTSRPPSTEPTESTPLLSPTPSSPPTPPPSPVSCANGDYRLFLDDVTRDFSCHVAARQRCRRRILAALGLVLALNALFAYLVYGQPVVPVRVVSLNVWGWPWKFHGCRDYEARMLALSSGRVLRPETYDVLFLQGLWMESDHRRLARSLPETMHITDYRQTSHPDCDGRLFPALCSGLAIVSRYPLRNVTFRLFGERGPKSSFEFLLGKGVARATVSLKNGDDVDLFNAHLMEGDGPDSELWRREQMREVREVLVRRGTSETFLLAGTLNVQPNATSWPELPVDLANPARELFPLHDDWLRPNLATYGNRQNTYSGRGNSSPAILDYILYRPGGERTKGWATWFGVNILKTTIVSRDGRKIDVSLSDHEAIQADLNVRAWSRVWPFL